MRSDGGYQAGQRAAAEEYSARHRRSRDRTETGCGRKLARGAGTQAQLMAKEGKLALLKLPSGEQRMVLAECRATIGQVGNLDHENISIGKAGRSRWLGSALMCAVSR